MARRDTPKREAKKPKKSSKRVEIQQDFVTTEVAVTGKRRKPKQEE